jgi:hypothetical protein
MAAPESTASRFPDKFTYTADQKAQIVSLYVGGTKTRAITLSVGGSRRHVLAVLRESGVIPPLARDSKGPSQDKRAVARRQLRDERRFLGVCLHCPAPVFEGMSLCERHLEAQRNRQKAKRENRRCNDCGKTPLPQRSRCRPCLDKFRERNAALTSARKAVGVCSLCGKTPAAPNRNLCVACLDRGARLIRERTQARAVGGQCTDCGRCIPLPNYGACEACFFKRRSQDCFGTNAKAEALRDLFLAGGGVCPYSGLPLTLGVDAQLDHILPFARGGKTDLANLHWVHALANQLKGDLTEAEFFDLIGRIHRHRLIHLSGLGRDVAGHVPSSR